MENCYLKKKKQQHKVAVVAHTNCHLRSMRVLLNRYSNKKKIKQHVATISNRKSPESPEIFLL